MTSEKKVRAEQYSASDVMNMVDNLHDAEETEGLYIDDVNGGELSKEKVAEPRKCELRTFRDMNVYTYVRREEAQSRGKIHGVRWVDSLQGGIVKSRLVAQEFASGGDRDDFFAATHPLMASKFVLSDTASRNTVGATSRRLCVLDVNRAFLYGLVEEEIYMELPDEDIWKKQGFVGKLIRAMYGTRSSTLNVAEGGEGENEGTRLPCTCHGSVLVLSSSSRCVRCGSRGRLLMFRRNRRLSLVQR